MAPGEKILCMRRPFTFMPCYAGTGVIRPKTCNHAFIFFIITDLFFSGMADACYRVKQPVMSCTKLVMKIKVKIPCSTAHFAFIRCFRHRKKTVHFNTPGNMMRKMVKAADV